MPSLVDSSSYAFCLWLPSELDTGTRTDFKEMQMPLCHKFGRCFGCLLTWALGRVKAWLFIEMTLCDRCVVAFRQSTDQARIRTYGFIGISSTTRVSYHGETRPSLHHLCTTTPPRLSTDKSAYSPGFVSMAL